VPLDRHVVERHSGRQIADLQQTRHVSDEEKRRIRRLHEQAALRAEQKNARRR